MSRFSNRRSYGHRIMRFSADHVRLSWTVDFYYPGSQLRFPRGFSRDTGEAGALRFAKKWKVQMPVPAKALSATP